MGVFNVSPLTSPPAVIINRHSAGGVVSAANFSINTSFKLILSGALTATTYKEVLSITGAGVVSIALAYSVDATDRTIGLKLVFDAQATAAFDAVSDTFSTTGRGIVAVGILEESGAVIIPEPMVFNTSLSVYVKSSLNETDKIGLGVVYRTI